MVSTRQMATSICSSSGQNTNATNTAIECARLSVVTRQTSSNYVFVNCSTIAPVSTRDIMQGSANPTAAPSTAVSTRHTQLTQAFKTCDTTNNVTNICNLEDFSRDELKCTNTIESVNLLDLPTELLTKIISYENFKRIGQLRLVSQKFNEISMRILNSTFSKLITQTFDRFQTIKASMPRRESARRNHPLSCECDVIETCYMRLSLLQMTFGKHIERGHCCFFPGAILDEVYTILNYIKNTPRLERPYRVTDELFDLSTMAMEYFRDHIESTLPNIAYFNKDFYNSSTKRPALIIAADLSDNSSDLPSPPQSNMVLRKGIRKIKEGMKIYNNQLSVLRNELRTCKRKSSEQGKQIAEQQKLLAEQQKQTLEYANRLDENDKKNEEMARKFSTLLQELNKCKTELQYWRSKSPAIPICTLCGQKVPPILPPEDYHALINQGVKPENIILNMADDTNTEVDISFSENNVTEFVFPDETTTAKLLSISSASRNLKRQQAATASNLNTSTSNNNSSSILGNDNNATVLVENICNKNELLSNVNSKQVELKNLFEQHTHHINGNNIIKINNNSCCTPATSFNQSDIEVNNTYNDKLNQNNIEVNGYSTKLFYGTNTHKGVIVSPTMLAAKSVMKSNNHSDIPDNNSYRQTNTDLNNSITAINHVAIDNNTVNDTVDDETVVDGNGTEDVTSLQAIVSHETKKARRVQKATRCLNTGSKRSK